MNSNMNKLVISEEGNYINLISNLSQDKIYDIDSKTKGCNFREIVDTLKNHLKHSKSTIYSTRDKIYLLEFASTYFYNEETKRFEVYILRNNNLYNIHDLTEKEIRKAHNLYNMYWAGAFDENKEVIK